MSDGLSDSLNISHIIDSCGCSRIDGKIGVICRVHSAVPIIESSSTEAPSPYTIKTSGTGEPFVPAPKELHKAVKNALFGHRVPSKEEFEKSTKDHEEHMKAAKEYYAEAGSIFEYVDRRLPDVHINLEVKKPMTKKEYFEFHQACVEKMSAITKAKNADYTGIGDDPFANFTRVEVLGICSTEQGFLTRMMDKLSRINSFAQKGELQVKDESVEDTLLDLANYAILFAGYIRSKK